MVEKIMITPYKVRGYGNIISPKTGADFTVSDCTLIVDTDTVDGELVTVYNLQPSTTVLSVSLTVDDNSVLIGESVTLTATVEDEMFDPVSGASVSFKLGGSSIGTSTTNNSGIATYTYTCNTVGTLTFTASCMGNNSNNVNVTVTGHDYSLTFSSTSYTTNSSGDATVSAVLTDNGVSVSGATVTFTGGTSTVTATTNSSGVATATVHFTSDGTLTATSNGATDTCSIILLTYLFYDDCSSASGLSNYGTLHQLRVQNVAGTLTYDSGMNAYKITTTTANNDGFCDFPIPALDNKDSYYIEAEFYTTDTTTGGQPGLVVYPTTSTGGYGVFYRDIASINRCGVLKFNNWAENGESGNSQQSSLPVGNNWIRVRLEVNGTSVKGIWSKTDGTEVYNHTYTVPYNSGELRVGLTALLKFTSYPYYVRNIKAEYL